MSEQLYKVTEFFGITMAVFTCSRDNAKSNDCLLHDFEKKVQEQYENLSDMNKLSTIYGSRSQMEISGALPILSILQFKPVRNPAE
jgi:hypothetical protein